MRLNEFLTEEQLNEFNMKDVGRWAGNAATGLGHAAGAVAGTVAQGAKNMWSGAQHGYNNTSQAMQSGDYTQNVNRSNQQRRDNQGYNNQGGNTQGGNTQGGNTQGGNTQGGNTQGGGKNAQPAMSLAQIKKAIQGLNPKDLAALNKFISTAQPKPGTAAPGTAAPGTETSGTAAPGTAAPGTETSGTETSGTAAPGTAAPGTAAPTGDAVEAEVTTKYGTYKKTNKGWLNSKGNPVKDKNTIAKLEAKAKSQSNAAGGDAPDATTQVANKPSPEKQDDLNNLPPPSDEHYKQWLDNYLKQNPDQAPKATATGNALTTQNTQPPAPGALTVPQQQQPPTPGRAVSTQNVQQPKQNTQQTQLPNAKSQQQISGNQNNNGPQITANTNNDATDVGYRPIGKGEQTWKNVKNVFTGLDRGNKQDVTPITQQGAKAQTGSAVATQSPNTAVKNRFQQGRYGGAGAGEIEDAPVKRLKESSNDPDVRRWLRAIGK